MISLPPLLAASDGIDLPQIIFVVIFLLVGFIQWLIKLWSQKREEAERAHKPPPSAEEIEVRRRAWQQQTGPPPPPSNPAEKFDRHPTATTPPPLAGGGLGDLLETFRKTLEEQQQPPPPPPVPPSAPAAAPPPPPLPAVREVRPPASTPVPVYQIPPPRSIHAPVTALSRESVEAYALRLPPSSSHAGKKPSRRTHHPLAEMLRTTHGYRNAFILKEVLSPPKALQNSPWPTDS